MKDRMGSKGLLRRLSDNAPRWLDQLPEIPDLVLNTMVEVGELSDTNRRQTQVLAQVQGQLEAQARRARFQRLGGLALIGALLSLLLPASGYAADLDTIIPGSVLGTLGIYWMYIHS